MAADHPDIIARLAPVLQKYDDEQYVTGHLPLAVLEEVYAMFPEDHWRNFLKEPCYFKKGTPMEVAGAAPCQGRAAPPEQPPRETPPAKAQCSYTGFDLCEHEYAQLCFDALYGVYGESRLVPADSNRTLAAAAAASDEEGKPRCIGTTEVHVRGGETRIKTSFSSSLTHPCLITV